MKGYATGYFGWAENDQGAMVHVGEVERGGACNCFCATCRKPVIARQGDVRIWHFAHRADTACNGESALHRAAKEVLIEAVNGPHQMRIPSGLTPSIDDVTVETKVGRSKTADALATLDGKVFGIEIRVTHAKKLADREHYASADVEAFEIDLSRLPHHVDRMTLVQAVLHDAKRLWLYKRGMALNRLAPRPARPATPLSRPANREEIARKVCDYLTSREGQTDSTVAWPVIRAAGVTPLESSPDEWKHGTICPKLYRVRHPGMFSDSGTGGPQMRIEGKVATPRGTARVDVVLTFDIITPPIERPTLLIVCPARLQEPSWPGALFMRWHGIDAWRTKLTNEYLKALARPS